MGLVSRNGFGLLFCVGKVLIEGFDCVFPSHPLRELTETAIRLQRQYVTTDVNARWEWRKASSYIFFELTFSTAVER